MEKVGFAQITKERRYKVSPLLILRFSDALKRENKEFACIIYIS
jgi:hypothetical protein